MTRARRRITGWLGIVALLFAQLAVAVHACPKLAAAAAPTEARAAMPCEQVDLADSSLCRKHCKGSEQAQGSAPTTLSAFAPAFIATIEPAAIACGVTLRAEPALLHATSPPPTIRNCCLRI